MAYLPSRDAFPFSNAWPSQPAVKLGTLGVGNAKNGLCGGMVFAALDYWYAGTTPPADQPVLGHPLYRYVVKRLIASWRLPVGVARYYRWMNLSDQQAATRTLTVQLPQIMSILDGGTPVPLGVVTIASANPAALRFNHQVLAYAYEKAGDQVTVRVYDPNRGNRDDVAIHLPTFKHNLGLGQRPVRGFFQKVYKPATPPDSLPA